MKVCYESVSIVIPAFNEENGIQSSLESLLANAPEAEIIVVDDGSTDRTGEVVSNFPQIMLVRHSFNRGYGSALKTGMSAAKREYIAWFDADNEHRFEDLELMVEKIQRERLAAVIGQRSVAGTTIVRGVGKRVILMLARSLGFKGGSDMNCGLRIFQSDVILQYLPLLPNQFSASLTSLMVLLERGYPIGYSPVETAPRIGESKVKLSDGFDALLLVFRVIMLFSPIRIFGPLALSCFAFGAVYSTITAVYQGSGFPVLGMFLMLLAILVGMLGLIADQLSQMRISQIESSYRREKPTRGNRRSGKKLEGLN